MELSGQQIVAAPRQAVWDALNDPRALYECIPGCEDIEKISGEETRVRVAVKLSVLFSERWVGSGHRPRSVVAFTRRSGIP